MSEIHNCRITGTMLGVEDHGIFTAMLSLEGDCFAIGFGGYALDAPSKDRTVESYRVGTAYGLEWIRRLLECLKVDKWESLEGIYVRLELENHSGGPVAIGHITQNSWFRPKTDMQLLALTAKKEAQPA